MQRGGAVLDRLAKGAHVAVIRLRSLGDCVLTTPALALLKNHRPDLRVGVVVEPRFAAVFEGNPDVDDILEPQWIRLRRFAPQLCVNLHGGGRSVALALASGARFRAAFNHQPAAKLANIRIPRAQEILGVDRKVHTAEHLASAMFYLGTPLQPVPRARLQARPSPIRHPYAVIHPLASSDRKTWPAERFCEVARKLWRHYDLEPIFIGACGEDLRPFRPFRTHTGSLDETKSLIASTALFLGNDSGPAHMAAAFDVPLVVLFAASDPVVWAPWRASAATQLVAAEGMSSLSVETVLEAIERLRVRA